MCIIIAKYFNEYGWVGIKNRDRNYIPEISFKKEKKNGMEIMYFWDDITQYCEGFNSSGIVILSSSLMVLDDEKEIEERSKTPSKDGIKIKNALKFSNIDHVIRELIKNELTGNTIIFNVEHCFILEGAWHKLNGDSTFEYTIHKIPKNTFIVRTNHGIELPWAGYQRDNELSHTLSRISSESRKTIAKFVTESANDPYDILNWLTVDYTGNGQLNALRTTTEKKKMRTTSQIMIIPKEHSMFVRPIQSNIIYNFWDLNNKDSNTWVEILSNRVLHMGDNQHAAALQKLKHDI